MGLFSKRDANPQKISDLAHPTPVADLPREGHLYNELDSLRYFVGMMGIDPDKAVEMANAREPVYPNILLSCLAPDVDMLKARCGKNTNVESWMKNWERLKTRAS